MNITTINKTITLSETIVYLKLYLTVADNGCFISFEFSINDLDVSGNYKWNKINIYKVSNGILSENIIKKLQEELKIIYLDNFD